MFDQLSGPVVLICGQNKTEAGSKEREKFVRFKVQHKALIHTYTRINLLKDTNIYMFSECTFSQTNSSLLSFGLLLVIF